MGRRYVALTDDGIQETTADTLSHVCSLASQRARFINRPLNVHDRQAGGFIVCTVKADGTYDLSQHELMTSSYATGDTVRHSSYPGVAFCVKRAHTEPNENTGWTGEEVETGNLIVVMVGDDREHIASPDDLEPLEEDDYCDQCGQIGCTYDGRGL